MNSNVSKISIGLAHEFMITAGKVGFTASEISELAQSETRMRALRSSYYSNAAEELLIDLDAALFVPDGWTVEEHRKGGVFRWNASRVDLYISDVQRNGGRIIGDKLRISAVSGPILNANVLDYLLAHPRHIPKIWRNMAITHGKTIHFFGTVYRRAQRTAFEENPMCVRGLCWHDDGWCESQVWLSGTFDNSDLIAAFK